MHVGAIDYAPPGYGSLISHNPHEHVDTFTSSFSEQTKTVRNKEETPDRQLPIVYRF
jgi:hypothetical protein